MGTFSHTCFMQCSAVYNAPRNQTICQRSRSTEDRVFLIHIRKHIQAYSLNLGVLVLNADKA